MNVDLVMARAYAASHQGIHYGLGAGGMNPGSATPASAGKCDCSGFVSWCLGMSRKTTNHYYTQQNGGWIETTAVWKDIGENAGMFVPAERVRGAIVVYPDAAGHEGHIGIVVDDNEVIHCSHGNDTAHGNAIRVTNFGVFNHPNTRFGWLYGMQG